MKLRILASRLNNFIIMGSIWVFEIFAEWVVNNSLNIHEQWLSPTDQVFAEWETLYRSAQLGVLSATHLYNFIDIGSVLLDISAGIGRQQFPKYSRSLTEFHGPSFRRTRKPIPMCTIRALKVCSWWVLHDRNSLKGVHDEIACKVSHEKKNSFFYSFVVRQKVL